ncbi:MAG: glutathione S-transferase N-terminal domain-containing protein [Candidatus Sericytochromatia bacterium]|nr:glutathione S-transferase N-terminal domain-containing protein [Candidatus Sericytochromatia bacterium]
MKIKFFYQEGSNCSNRVKWVLDYKKIDYKIIDSSKISTEEYKKVNHLLRIPGMLIDNKPLSESMVMCEFLESSFSENPLLPNENFAKAKVREICEIVNATIHPVQNPKIALFFVPELNDQEIKFYRVKWIRENLEKLLPILFLESNFACGTAFTLADIFVICIYGKGLAMGLDTHTFPKLNSHLNHCFTSENIKDSCPLYNDLQKYFLYS